MKTKRQIKIEVRYKEPNAEWKPVETSKAIDILKDSWNGDILELMQQIGTLWTPFAEYRIKP